MTKAIVGVFVGALSLNPFTAFADTITLTSGLSTPALRVTFDPQPEPPGIAAGPTASVALSTPVDAFWLTLMIDGSPMVPLAYEQLTDDTGGLLFGVRTTFDGGASPYYLDVMFDPQPEPPGRWALIAFDPQPEPPGRSVVGLGTAGAPLGFDAFIGSFDPQPEPPGIGDRGFYWFYEGSIAQGTFEGASFTLRTANGTPLGLTPVPDPGATLVLLSVGLLGVAVVRRRL
jgi:hypothetical protein